MPKLIDLTINDGTNDILFEPNSRVEHTSGFAADAPSVDRRETMTVSVPPMGTSPLRRETVSLTIPVVLDAETGEIATIRIRTEVKSDRRILDADVARALAIHRNALADAAVTESIVAHKPFIG